MYCRVYIFSLKVSNSKKIHLVGKKIVGAVNLNLSLKSPGLEKLWQNDNV